MKNRKFFVTISWDYNSPEHIEETCFICPATHELEEYNDYIVCNGSSGTDCHIYNNLKDAIIQSNFNPKYIKFNKLTIKEKIFKTKLIKEIIKGDK